jgi:hypothetical protein
MAAIFTGKIRGITPALATIATQDVEVHADGSLQFTVGGVKHRIMPSASLNALLKVILTGTGGFAATKKWVGNP